MSYSRDRERAISYEHKKLVSQGGNPDCANVLAKELVRGDEDKAKQPRGATERYEGWDCGLC